ncbi:MAG: gliding motility lipoprotein GldH [Bacteroidales bacterium]|nr:gliding motility lipoprotein GldH [Bacteroidales bacterium]
MRRPLYASILLLALSSCSSDERMAFSEFRDMGSQGWPRMAALDFTLPPDSVNDGSPKALMLSIRHTEATDCDTLWVAVERSAAGSPLSVDTIPVALADHRGAWLGKGVRGLYELTCTIDTLTSYPEDYSVTLTHAMTGETIPGIINVGLILSRQ